MTAPTAPTAYSFSTVRGRTVRITKVDACGMPVGGDASSFVTTGFITVKASKKMDSGTEIKVSNAADLVDVYVPGNQTLLNFDIEIDFSVSDSGALPMVSGDPVVLDWQGAVAGWEELALTPNTEFWALELWTGVAGQACVGDAVPFGYWAYPFIGNSYIDSDDVANKEVDFSLKATTFGGNAWGKGPYEVVAADVDNTPSRLLEAIDPRAHRHFEITTIAPPIPAATAGPAALVLPTPY